MFAVRTNRPRALLILATLAIAASVAGCARAPKVQNVDPATEGYLSGRWNDSDARAVADELIPQCLNSPWLFEYRGVRSERRPRIVIGDIENATSEHIDVDIFMNELKRVLINSGVIRFVADPSVREQLLKEVAWQEEMADGGGVAPDVAHGISGADFMMMGKLTSDVDQADDKAIVYYRVDLWLIDLRNFEEVWFGKAERKHLVEDAKIRF